MPSAPKKVDISKAIPGLEGLPLEKVEYKRVEDEQEKALRLEKERVSEFLRQRCSHMDIWIRISHGDRRLLPLGPHK